MYSEMTRDELIEQLRLADEEIARLREKSEALALDYDQAMRDVDYWQGMYLDSENKEASEKSRQERSDRRQLAEWNQWAAAVK